MKNRLQMIKALSHSKNTCTAGIMKRLLNGESTLEQEQCRNHGSFVTAVLNGDYETAIRKADSENKAALDAPELHPIFQQIFNQFNPCLKLEAGEEKETAR
jgi:hypothetical protein